MNNLISTQEQQDLTAVLNVTMRLGLLMLKSGTSSYRTDEAMRRAGKAMGADRVEAYVTPTGIIASVYRNGDDHTQIARMRSFGVNMQRVYELELLVRGMKDGADPAIVNEALDRIEHIRPVYPRWLVALACGVACGAFAVLRGGGPIEFGIAMVGATVAQFLRFKFVDWELQTLATTVVCATVASTLAILLTHVIQTPQASLAVVASVLLLVPGVPLVTSLLDLLLGNLVSGVSRGVHSLLIILSIGIGVLISISVLNFNIL